MSNLILGRFAPIDQAGAGGFAKVIHAYDTELTREVAIKIIPLDSEANADSDLAAQGFGGVGDNFQQQAKDQGRFARGRSQIIRSANSVLAAEEKFASILGGPSHRDQTEVLPPSVSLVGNKDKYAGAQNAAANATQAWTKDSSGVFDASGASGTPDVKAAAPSADIANTPGLKEARAASTLDDPSIVKIHDFRQQGNLGYLIMEYVDGVSLADLITKYPDSLDADVIASVFKSVAKALQVAHSKGVLHLDIKPANVLVTPKGQVKVVDFGLARLMDESGFGSAASGGTIGYMPPEQMRQEELDQRCDEWALASLTYQLITGTNPFIVDSLDEAEDAIYGAEIYVPSAFKEGIDESIDDIIFCALDPDRENRYDTVKAFAKELQPCLGSVKEGKAKLKNLVSSIKGQAALDETDDMEPLADANAADAKGPFMESAQPSIPLVDMFDTRSSAIFQRVCAVVGVLIVGFVAVGNFTPANDWSSPFAWGIYGVLVLLAGVLPHLGILATLLLFGAALICNGGIATGVVLILVSALWWFFVGRFSNTSANIALSTVIFGAMGGAALAPLLAGWALRSKNALVTAFESVVIAFSFGGLGSCSLFAWEPLSHWQIRMWTDLNANYLSMVCDPQMWIMAFAFVLAALVMSLFCYANRSWLNYLGTIAASLVLVAALLIGKLAITNGLSFTPSTFALLQIITVGIVMLIICLAGCPQKYDEDLEFHVGRSASLEDEVPW